MIEVKILDIQFGQIVEIVHDLRLKGYVLDVDFEFEYHPPKFDNLSGHPVYNRYVLFKFYKEELATWFSLLHQ